MKGAHYVRIATMIVTASAAVGMLAFAVDSVGQVPWWFLVAMALTVLNGVLVTYMMFLQSGHGSELAIERLRLVSRYLTWAMLVAVTVMLLRRG